MAELSIADQCDIKLKAEEVWADSQNQTEQYTAECESIRALAMQQKDRTQIITQLEDPNLEDDTVRILWVDNCDDAEDFDTQDVCDFSGPEPVLDYKDYSLAKSNGIAFAIDENKLRKSMYSLDELAAIELNNKMKQLDELVNRQSLLFLSANAGYNKHPESYTFNATTLEVPTSDYTEDLYIKMITDARHNLMKDAFVIDNGALFKYHVKADLERGNGEGDGAFRKKEYFNTYFDLVGFAESAISDTSFLVSPSAYAFASRAYNPTAPVEVNPKSGWQQRFSIPSNNVPGLVYDVYYVYECEGKRFKHSWYIEMNYDFFVNPLGCDILVDTEPDVFDQVTGILSYTKVANP